MKLTKLNIFYEIAMGILAMVAVVFAVIDITSKLTPLQNFIDFSILIIFVIDYFARLFFSKDKKKFVRENVFDLLAIIPFNSFFKAFRFARITKIGRLAKLGKFFRFSAIILRFSKRTKRFLNTNGFKYILFLTTVMILLGGFLIQFAENMTFVDGLWWAFVTATTVGYGDISPSSGYGRLIAVFLMITGIGLLGTLTSTITSFFLNIGHKKSDANLVFMKNQIDELGTLDDEDIDKLCVLIKTYKKGGKNENRD